MNLKKTVVFLMLSLFMASGLIWLAFGNTEQVSDNRDQTEMRVFAAQAIPNIDNFRDANALWLPIRPLTNKYRVAYSKISINSFEEQFPTSSAKYLNIVSSSRHDYSGSFNRGAFLADPAEFILYDSAANSSIDTPITGRESESGREYKLLTGILSGEIAKRLAPFIHPAATDYDYTDEKATANTWFGEATPAAELELAYKLSFDADMTLMRAQYWLRTDKGIAEEAEFLYRYNRYYYGIQKQPSPFSSTYPTSVLVTTKRDTSVLSPNEGAKSGVRLQSSEFGCTLVDGKWFVLESTTVSERDGKRTVHTTYIPLDSIKVGPK